MGAIISLGCKWWKNLHRDRCMTGSTPHYIPPLEFFPIRLNRLILRHDSLKTFVEGVFITGTLNVNNFTASVVNYCSNIEHDVTESSSNGDLLNTDEV